MLGVFWLKGFASTSLQDLSEATGLKQGSLYAAFNSKEEMFQRSISRYLVWLGQELTTPAKGLDGIRAVLSTVARLTIDDTQRRGCPLINAIAESEALSDGLREELAAGLKAMLRRMRRYVVEADRMKHAPSEVDDLAALLLAASVSLRVLGKAKAPAPLLRQVVEGACLSAAAWANGPRKPAS